MWDPSTGKTIDNSEENTKSNSEEILETEQEQAATGGPLTLS